MYWQIIRNNKKIQIFLISIIAVIFFIAIISIFTIANRSDKIAVTIDFQPAEAKVYLDNSNKNINQTTLYLPAGEYRLSAYLNDYYYSESIVNVNEYTPTLLGQLIPINATKDEIAGLVSNLSQANSAAYSEINSLLADKFPLSNYLPYSSLDDTFYITPELNQDYSVLSVIINLQAKDSLLAANTAYGILESFDPDLDLSSYNITITNFTNPFENNFHDNNQSNAIAYLKTGFSDIKDLTIQKGRTNGDYYYTVIEQALDPTASDYLPYRVVLKKKNNSWELINTPTPILTIYNTPDVPQEILDKANKYNQRSQK